MAVFFQKPRQPRAGKAWRHVRSANVRGFMQIGLLLIATRKDYSRIEGKSPRMPPVTRGL
jgi:hypothetical protein